MKNQSSLKDHLYHLENLLLQPEIRTAPAELEKLLADDFFEFGSSGNVYYKADCITESGIEVREMTLSDFEIHPLSADTVLTTFRLHDETRKQKTLRSSIWKFRDGRWQMFFHQGTKINS